MANSVPLQIAETIQTATIVHDPTAERNIAPSTAADVREPVVLEKVGSRKGLDEDPLELDPLDDEEEDDEDGDSPYSVIRPWDPTVDRYAQSGRAASRPHQQLPPLPDLRFEQSYLRSLAAADKWWKVALITVRDQMLMPFVQGLLYNLAVCGWQYWNRSAKLSGQSVGARVRRWWWGVNNWTIPGTGALAAVAQPNPNGYNRR